MTHHTELDPANYPHLGENPTVEQMLQHEKDWVNDDPGAVIEIFDGEGEGDSITVELIPEIESTEETA